MDVVKIGWHRSRLKTASRFRAVAEKGATVAILALTGARRDEPTSRARITSHRAFVRTGGTTCARARGRLRAVAENGATVAVLALTGARRDEPTSKARTTSHRAFVRTGGTMCARARARLAPCRIQVTICNGSIYWHLPKSVF